MASQSATELFQYAYGMLRGLMAQFVVGIIIATVAPHNAETKVASTAHVVGLGLHIIIALALLFGSTAMLVKARQTGTVVRDSWLGFAAIVVAFGSGIAQITTSAGEVATLIMGLAFIAAVVIYGRVAVLLRP